MTRTEPWIKRFPLRVVSPTHMLFASTARLNVPMEHPFRCHATEQPKRIGSSYMIRCVTYWKQASVEQTSAILRLSKKM